MEREQTFTDNREQEKQAHRVEQWNKTTERNRKDRERREFLAMMRDFQVQGRRVVLG